VRSKVWTIPNILTFLRLGCLPIFVYVAVQSPFAGAIFVAVLASTDYLDGWIARRFHQESELGRILDPISDRALVLISFVVFIITGSIPWWYAILVAGREILITIGTLIVFWSHKVRLDVNRMGKVSAFAAMVATPSWVLYSETHGTVKTFWGLVAWISSIITIPTGYYSLVHYYREYRKLTN
jgi:cardiolipin synthase